MSQPATTPVVPAKPAAVPLPGASDVLTVGDLSMFRLLWRASSKLGEWTQSCSAMEVPGGCIVVLATGAKNPDGTYFNSERVVFVPGVKTSDDGNKGRKLVAL